MSTNYQRSRAWREHVQYEWDMFCGCHERLCEGIPDSVLRNAVHEAFYVHMKNLLWYYAPITPEAVEYRSQIRDQIMTLGPRRTPPHDISRLRTPDMQAVALIKSLHDA